MTLLVSFTGTRSGMTPMQLTRFTHVMAAICAGHAEITWHDGDCIGADDEAHQVVTRLKRDLAMGVPSRVFWMVGHPSNIPSLRAGNVFDVLLDEKDPLDRNHDMVDATEVLVACPGEKNEVTRSGTWSTIRYARRLIKAGRKIVIMYVWPDGTLDWEGEGHELER